MLSTGDGGTFFCCVLKDFVSLDCLPASCLGSSSWSLNYAPSLKAGMCPHQWSSGGKPLPVVPLSETVDLELCLLLAPPPARPLSATHTFNNT